MKNRHKHNNSVIFVLICLLAPFSFGANIFVDNQLPDDCIGTYSIANRDNSGSETAYNTPQEAADIVNPGDVVYFREGTYRPEVTNDSAVVMNVIRSGTPDNPITFKNYNNEEVIFSGTRTDRPGHYRVLTLGSLPSSSHPVSGSGVQNIVVDGFIVEGASETSLGIFGPADNTGMAENPTENPIFGLQNQAGTGLGKLGVAPAGGGAENVRQAAKINEGGPVVLDCFVPMLA